MPMPSIPADKANHVIYGAVAFVAGAFAAHPAGLPPAYCGLALAVIAGAIKEASDALINYRATGNPMVGPHGVEWLDFAATACGGVLGFVAVLCNG